MVQKLGAGEEIPALPGTAVVDFWSWAFSNLASNALRGTFAEFLVASALGVTSQPRIEWDLADLHYLGHPIEVKSSADHQVWTQDRPSQVRFDIRRTRGWNSTTNVLAADASRSADAYVFCHFHGPAESVAVLDGENWDFYVLSTTTIDEELDTQKSIGIVRLRALAARTDLAGLRSAVDAVLR